MFQKSRFKLQTKVANSKEIALVAAEDCRIEGFLIMKLCPPTVITPSSHILAHISHSQPSVSPLLFAEH